MMKSGRSRSHRHPRGMESIHDPSGIILQSLHQCLPPNQFQSKLSQFHLKSINYKSHETNDKNISISIQHR